MSNKIFHSVAHSVSHSAFHQAKHERAQGNKTNAWGFFLIGLGVMLLLPFPILGLPTILWGICTLSDGEKKGDTKSLSKPK